MHLRRDNVGVLLRRKLDYKFPNQSAEVYVANRRGVNVTGTNTRKFRVNLLVKNAIAGSGSNAGQTVYYGSVGIASGTYLLGSLLGWQVTTSGAATIEKQAAEGSTSGGGTGSSSSDRLAYQVIAWKELP